MTKNFITFRKTVLTIDGIGNTTEVKKLTKIVELPFIPQRDMVIFDGFDFIRVGVLEYSLQDNVDPGNKFYFNSDAGTIRDGEEKQYLLNGWV